jgi:hypothetical protein
MQVAWAILIPSFAPGSSKVFKTAASRMMRSKMKRQRHNRLGFRKIDTGIRRDFTGAWVTPAHQDFDTPHF